jgi:hypothetical protein
MLFIRYNTEGLLRKCLVALEVTCKSKTAGEFKKEEFDKDGL